MTNYSVKTIGYVLAGAGLDRLGTNIQTALLLIGVGVALEIVVSILQKYNVPISSHK